MTYQKINTALLSYGMSGEIFHTPLLEAHPGFEIKAIVHRNSAKPVTHQYPVVSSADEIFNNKSIELVIVNTPNELHFSDTKKALEAGKHVIVEKPFTVTTVEADELMALAKKQNKILTVFQNRRFDGDFLTVKKVIESKYLGKLAEFEAHYDRFRNYVEQNTWKELSTPGTGILYNLGSHMLDQVIVLFGMPLYLDARIGTQRPDGKVIDFYDIRLEYKGFQAIVKSSYLVREPGPRYILHGSEGSFLKSALDPQEQALKEKKIPGSPGWGTEPEQYWGKLNTFMNGVNFKGSIETLPGNYLNYYKNIYEVIREGKELAVKPEEARQVIALIEASYESSKSRRAVKIT